MSTTFEREQATSETKHWAGSAVPTPTLSVFDATMITVGIVIGAGIFQTPSMVAGIAGSPSLMLAAWVLGGVLSLIGALTYAELATTYPSAGGDYTFLTRAYGKQVSFLFAWARSMVICTGSIALLGFILGDYLTRLFDLGAYSSAIYAALAVVLLTVINLVGLRGSSRMQNVLTLFEISGVLLVAIAGMTLDPAPVPIAATSSEGGGAFGLAMVFVLLTFGGWNEAAYVSAEVRGGPRALVRTLVVSIGIITAAYLIFVGSVLHGLGFEQLKASQAVGVDVIERAFGPLGGQLIGVIVAVAALTSMNSTMIVGARSNYSVAQDWPTLRFMGQWQSERHAPVVGFTVQAVIALALIVFGALEKDGFSTMVEFTAPVFWFFFMLSGIALLVLRRRDPERPRPFQVPWYPLLPLVFVAMCAYLLYSSITYAQSQNAGYVALVVMLSGAFVLLVLHLRARTGPAR
ncbi:APC family permease [Steroidobacter sp.]|uniref:APC family permease n=1 Tax=Steroidobacter sp. TaxID=1978227 RepID=UPI001A560178|nr:amino acid permease [Steroidobacter sp.]MBL8272059.1 amino acid permease [Steroidobacter sp.]